MAGVGPPPKPKAQRRRRNKEETLEVPGTVPAELASMPLEGDHLPETVRWWRAWCTSPQVSTFNGTDWERLRMLVPIVDVFWSSGSLDCLREIRLNESLLGATVVDRMRGRINAKPPDPKPEGEARRAVSARQRFKVV